MQGVLYIVENDVTRLGCSIAVCWACQYASEYWEMPGQGDVHATREAASLLIPSREHPANFLAKLFILVANPGKALLFACATKFGCLLLAWTSSHATLLCRDSYDLGTASLTVMWTCDFQVTKKKKCSVQSVESQLTILQAPDQNTDCGNHSAEFLQAPCSWPLSPPEGAEECLL